MAKIVWTNPALSDLNEIAEYIALSNILAARSLIQTVFNKIERLENFPESGKIPIEIDYLNYREVVVPPCRIFYKVDHECVYILYVMRQEQSLKKFLLSR